MVVTCGICIKRYPVMACHNWDCSDLNRCSHFLLFSKDNQYQKISHKGNKKIFQENNSHTNPRNRQSGRDRSGGLPALLHEKLRSGRKYPSPEAGHQSGDCHPTPAQRGRHRRTDRKNTARKQNMERLCLHRCAARFARIYREIHPQGPFVFRTQRQG